VRIAQSHFHERNPEISSENKKNSLLKNDSNLKKVRALLFMDVEKMSFKKIFLGEKM